MSLADAIMDAMAENEGDGMSVNYLDREIGVIDGQFEMPEVAAAIERATGLTELRAAVAFLDRVRTATEVERIAAGTDHWDRLERAARAVVAVL